MDTLVKFCGLRTRQDIEAVDILRPDYAGFILSKRFWRYANPETARFATGYFGGRIKTVGVIVDEPLEYAAELLNLQVVDIIQLHGSEDNLYIDELRRLAPGKPIFKAFKVEKAEDIERAEQSIADEILLDSGTGSGECFDWSLLKDVDRRFILAGGLEPGNVRAAIEQINPWMVDVSSGIETDKVKDFDKMKEFIKNVRQRGGKSNG